MELSVLFDWSTLLLQSQESQGLDKGMRSFYEAMAEWANIIPPICAVVGLLLCVLSGFTIFRCVYTRDGGIDIDDHQIPKHILTFVIGALVGISSIVTYAMSSVWTGG